MRGHSSGFSDTAERALSVFTRLRCRLRPRSCWLAHDGRRGTRSLCDGVRAVSCCLPAGTANGIFGFSFGSNSNVPEALRGDYGATSLTSVSAAVSIRIYVCEEGPGWRLRCICVRVPLPPPRTAPSSPLIVRPEIWRPSVALQAFISHRRARNDKTSKISRVTMTYNEFNLTNAQIRRYYA